MLKEQKFIIDLIHGFHIHVVLQCRAQLALFLFLIYIEHFSFLVLVGHIMYLTIEFLCGLHLYWDFLGHAGKSKFQALGALIEKRSKASNTNTSTSILKD